MRESAKMNLPLNVPDSIVISLFFVAILIFVKQRAGRKCSSCGQRLSNPHNFCGNCGFHVSNEILQSRDLDTFLKNRLKARKRYFHLALAATISIPILPLATMLFFFLMRYKKTELSILDFKAHQILTLNITAVVILFFIALTFYLSGAKCPVCGAYIAAKSAHGNPRYHDNFCRVCGTRIEEYKKNGE